MFSVWRHGGNVVGESWIAAAVRYFGAEVIVLQLFDEHRGRVMSAQDRQRMVNSDDA